jgi:Tol biopolymer transport system component/DNA-binding winged helix-turn-helix (wHTH) protein
MTEPNRKIRFDVFEVDRQTGEIRKNGLRIKLADQPFRVLVALLENPGELVGREELQQLLWSDEISGDFEQGLNRAVNRLRGALRDSAARPRFIETLPGRGYRFVAEVKREPSPIPAAARPKWRPSLAIAGAALAVALLGYLIWLSLPPAVPILRSRRLTTDNYNKIPPALSDGTRVYFLANHAGEQFIAQIPARGGQPARLPITLPGPSCTLQDLSPDGQEILLTAGTALDRKRLLPLWTLQIGDGTARRVGTVSATSAAYSSDGAAIAFTSESELWVLPKGGTPHRLVEMKDSFLSAACWEPGGHTIRFARQNPLSTHSSAWEVHTDGTHLRQVLPEWQAFSHVPVGWTPDRRLELFAAEGNFWITPKGRISLRKSDSLPTKATEDELEFSEQAQVRNRASFSAIGIDRLGELQRYDRLTKQWVPLLDGISAEAAEYSRDGRRVVYVSYPQRTLWVREADGKRPIQITSPPMIASYPHWSPDGKQIAFNGQEAPNKTMKVYLVDAEGGAVRLAAPKETGSEGDPTWSPDGKKLLFGLNARSTREAAYIRIADLENGNVAKFPGSEGLFAPRWSPDGKMIAVLEWEGLRRLMLYRFDKNQWTPISEGKADWPTWAADNKSIMFRADETLQRVWIDPRTTEAVASLKGAEPGGFSHALGVTPDGSPTRTLNRDSRQVYELQFQNR